MLTQIERVGYAGLLLAKAFGRHGTTDIYPPAACVTIDQSLTNYCCKVQLWYNVKGDESTHMETMEEITHGINQF